MKKVNFVMTHELKTDRPFFDDVTRGDKTYEIRKDDRSFHEEDFLWLRETVHTGAEMVEGKPLLYTGREAYCQIAHILRGPIYGLKEGWCILSIRGVVSN